MNGIRFYLEFTDLSKRQSSGTVVAALTINGIYWSSGTACYDAIAGLFDRPNAAVAGTGVALDYLRQKCKRISEAKARSIHPALFERLDRAVSNAHALTAADAGTVKDSQLVCPKCQSRTPIKVIRGDGRGEFGESRSLLRGWANRDMQPHSDDIFRERIYCIRWADTWVGGDSKPHLQRHFAAPTAGDITREEKVLALLKERFDDWQRKGFIPSRRIEPGAETARLARERGWTHWQHLFTPRQLLVNGLLAEHVATAKLDVSAQVALTLSVGRCADWNSRLSRWHPGLGNEKSEQTFSNQALNTLFNFGARPLRALDTTWYARKPDAPIGASGFVAVCDGRQVERQCDFWVTDPPYADAVAYEEVSEFFLSWYERRIPSIFPQWYGDSKRALAVTGTDEGFRRSMVDCYRRLATLVNLDLPWNPTRLEQRKGRIQRIGQLSDTVWVYNMRYQDSVEDRVHQLLSNRLQGIYTLFGQVPDVLEDVWIDVALGEVERAKQIIAAVPKQHPFDIKYQRIERIDWETCERVLSAAAKQAALRRGW